MTSVWKKLCQAANRSWRSLRGRVHRLRVAWLLSLSLPSIERLAVVQWCVRSVFDIRLRWNGIIRYETGRDLVGLTRADALRAMSGGVLERLLDRRLSWGRQLRPEELWPDLRDIAVRLAGQIEQLRTRYPRRPLILSPFHYVSQHAYVYVIDEVRKALQLKSISAVTGVSSHQHGKDAGIMPHIEPLHTNDKGDRNNLALRVVQALRRDGVVVLFADVPPYTMEKFPMDTVGVSILGRPGRIHDGAFRIGARMDALLLPFYLKFSHGRFGAHVFDAIELKAPDAPQRVADCIGDALTDNYSHWLMAGYPSMYAFSCVK